MSFVEHPVDGIAILLWASEPEAPQRLITPFHHAAAAAAMDLPVELYFSARSVRLLVPGVAAALQAQPGAGLSVLAALQQAVQHGARCYVCADALKAEGLSLDALIPECRALGGAVQFMARAASLRWHTLVF